MGQENLSFYTGKERDQESGNDYFGARYYAENDARFMSPDWSAKVEPVPYAKLGDPQSLNLYGYMLDSPLDGVDQDGHCPRWLHGVCNFGKSAWHLVRWHDFTPVAWQAEAHYLDQQEAKHRQEMLKQELGLTGHVVGPLHYRAVVDIVFPVGLEGLGGLAGVGEGAAAAEEGGTAGADAAEGTEAGTRADPQSEPGTGKDPSLQGRQNQLEEMERAQRDSRAGKLKKRIDSIERSRRNLVQSLKQIKSLQDVEDE